MRSVFFRHTHADNASASSARDTHGASSARDAHGASSARNAHGASSARNNDSRQAHRWVSMLMALSVSCACAGAGLMACADSTEDVGAGAGTDDGGGSSSGDATTKKDGSSGGADASSTNPDGGKKTTCEITRAYFEGCNNTSDLNCGASFDSWCAANDVAINSEAYRRAEAACLTQDNCDGKKRRDCEYSHYNSETPTASEAALVAAYCQTCEPGDVTGCTTRSTKYDSVKGINSVGDIYVAAWELTDALCDDIKTKCTGAALDGGTDAGACAKKFGSCAADLYLAKVPDCPK